MIVREITPEIIPDIAEIHLRAFPRDHFTSRFSMEMLTDYLTILTGVEDYKFFVSDENGRIAGYLIAGKNYHKAVNSYIRTNYLKVLRTLIFSPSFIIDKAKIFLMKLTGKVAQTSPDVSVNIIAVDPAFENRGIGSVLMDHLEAELQKDGIGSYILYVKGNNEPAVTFYRKKSFQIIEQKGDSLKLRKQIAEKNITS